MTRILIVDDEPSSRAVLSDLLLPECYDVATADSGFAGLEAAHQQVPDVIITDLMMPGMDGFELCRRLRATEAFRGTPIVVVTALDSRDQMARALDAGATDFITKPVNGTEVRARVRSMVRIAREQQTLRQLLALRTDLTNMVIHDLRNPLQVILMSADVMQRQVADPGPPLRRIQTQVHRLQQLIDDLLVIAKSDAGVLVARREPIDATPLLDLVADDCRAAADARDIILVTFVVADRPLYADRELLRRCLDNLILNAIKFSPMHTAVTISLVDEGEEVRIEVADEGPGIREELREAVFQRFVTVGMADPTIRQTGLGLAFCRLAVETHRGTIAAIPRQGGGTIFRIALPAVTTGAGEGSPLPAS